MLFDNFLNITKGKMLVKTFRTHNITNSRFEEIDRMLMIIVDLDMTIPKRGWVSGFFFFFSKLSFYEGYDKNPENYSKSFIQDDEMDQKENRNQAR